jgi:hypothetical protein
MCAAWATTDLDNHNEGFVSGLVEGSAEHCCIAAPNPL